MINQKSEYELQAEEFLANTGTTFKAVLLGHMKYFDTDLEKRDIYEITLERKGKSYTFKFGQSFAKSGGNHLQKRTQQAVRRFGRNLTTSEHQKLAPQAPTAYDILACIEKNAPETFEDFCFNYGHAQESSIPYERDQRSLTDSRSALKTYLAVQDEYENVIRLFGDVMEDLQDLT